MLQPPFTVASLHALLAVKAKFRWTATSLASGIVSGDFTASSLKVTGPQFLLLSLRQALASAPWDSGSSASAAGREAGGGLTQSRPSRKHTVSTMGQRFGAG